MARLFEYQGKDLLGKSKIPVPGGRTARTPEEVQSIAEELNVPVVIKIQAWVTGRASIGGIKFADTPDEAKNLSEKLFGMKVKNFTVDTLLVEEKLAVKKEFYAGVIIDDTSKMPVVIFSSMGGTGIEEIAEKYPDKVARAKVPVTEGLPDYRARELIRKTGVTGKLQMGLAGILSKLVTVAKKFEARSAEINPILLLENGKLVAGDCRVTVDDYAVFRHPELGIEIARELDRPPTELEKIAYKVEANDYRGTFYFIQMEEGFEKGDNFVGFHGAGGGGSMMSMDALIKKGFKIANFTDTSGNPPASKVYRAAKIILSQGNIDAYFGSGSGVASQEQVHSARGLVKAFLEDNLNIPTVIRLGGNLEEKAVEILEKYTKEVPATVEGYGKNDSPDFCADRLAELLANEAELHDYEGKSVVKREPAKEPYSFDSVTGKVTFDHELCRGCESKVCVKECVPQILKLENDVPVLAIDPADAKKGKCTECLVCEIECRFNGNKGGFVDLPIPGMD